MNRLAAFAVAVSCLGCAVTAWGAAVTDRITAETEFSNLIVPNFCTGELINESGTVRTSVKLTQNANGLYRVNFHYHFKAKGIGDQGNVYVINQEARERSFDAPKGAWVLSYSEEFVQISKGPGDNSRYQIIFTLVWDADGNITIREPQFRLVCHG